MGTDVNKSRYGSLPPNYSNLLEAHNACQLIIWRLHAPNSIACIFLLLLQNIIIKDKTSQVQSFIIIRPLYFRSANLYN